MFLQLTVCGVKTNIVRTVIGHHFKLCDVIESDGSIIYKFTTPSTTSFYLVLPITQPYSTIKANPAQTLYLSGIMAEMKGFEPLKRFHVYMISNHAPSTS